MPISIGVDGAIYTAVDVTQSTTLVSVRVMVNMRCIEGIPKAYTFASGDNSVTVPRENESTLHAHYFFPQLNLIPLNEDNKRRRESRSESPSDDRVPMKRAGVNG